jgi:RNA polymerase sigma-70 factor (ECF subfamily)
MEHDIKKDFDTLYNAHAKAIYRFAFLKTGSQEMAHDVTAETFCRYYEYSQTHKAIDNEKAFLYRIARNYIIDWYRKKSKEGVIAYEIDVHELAASDDIIKDLSVRELYAEVRKAMKHLKKEYEDIIFLHFVEDLSVQEIAKVINATENNTRVTLHRAIASLKKKFSFNEKDE